MTMLLLHAANLARKGKTRSSLTENEKGNNNTGKAGKAVSFYGDVDRGMKLQEPANEQREEIQLGRP